MVAIKKRYQGEEERTLLLALIMSDKVLEHVHAQLKGIEDPFRSKHANLVAKWCFHHYERFHRAPRRAVQSIFRRFAETSTNEDLVDSLESLLEGISDEGAEGFNEGFVLDLASNYLRKVRLERLRDDIDEALEREDLPAAERQLGEYSPVSFGSSDWKDPTDADVVSQILQEQEEREQNSRRLLRFRGDLDRFLCPHFEQDSFISFVGPEKRGKCIEASTPVLIGDGSVRTIKEIVEGGLLEEIVTWDEDLREFRKASIGQLWKNGRKNCWELTTKTGRKIVTTAHHLYLTSDGWKELESLKTGDFVAVPKTLPFFGTGTMCPEEVRFLAYMLAEGCTVQTYWRGKKHGCACSFTNVDKPTRKDFKHCCRKLGITYLDYALSVQLSGEARPLLRRHKVLGHSAKTKQIPEAIFRLEKSQVASFLRTFFTCDGCIYQDREEKKIELGLANETLLRQISHLLLRFGIVHSLNPCEKTCGGKIFPAWKIVIGSQEYVNLFLQEINFDSYKHTPVFVPTHNKSFLDRIPHEIVRPLWDQIKSRGKGALKSVFGGSRKHIFEQLRRKAPMMRQSFVPYSSEPLVARLLQSPVLWDEIKSIRFVGKRETYDLGVPESHNFVAGDLIVHNSFWLMEMAWQGMIQRKRVLYYVVGDMSFPQVMRRLLSRALRRPLRSGEVDWPKSIEKKDKDRVRVTMETKDFTNSISTASAVRAMRQILKKTGSRSSRLKIRCCGGASLSASEIEQDVRNYIRQDWIPEMVVIDYADLLAPEGYTSRWEYRHQINETWKVMRRIAMDYRLLLITGTQAAATSYGSSIIRKSDFSEDKRKNAHVTGMLGINQTSEEKIQGIYRLNWVFLRDGGWADTQVVWTAGCLPIACPCVVSVL